MLCRAADDGSEDDQLYCFHEHKSGMRLLRSRRPANAATPDGQTESAPASSESANSTDVTQPGTSSAADDLGLEMSVDEIDESEDERNEVLVDDSDID